MSLTKVKTYNVFDQDKIHVGDVVKVPIRDGRNKYYFTCGVVIEVQDAFIDVYASDRYGELHNFAIEADRADAIEIIWTQHKEVSHE